eukprot:m.48328 g.48328  ORF g.48328 m.48328 type:complete len:585 (-) comp10563_c0_seq1:1012-2766(-)
MDASCMQLSIEGERLLKAQDYKGAIEFFEAGLQVGTDDLEVLSAVYNQLGNACFYVGQFHKALEYHRKDLEIAKKLNDRQGQAKAYGNLGNTFKSLKKFGDAIKCCENHLRITRELADRLGEGRACYNLGNVHHAVGKGHLQRRKQDPDAKALGQESVRKAISYYKETLAITAELKDTAGEGRAVGNLGNAYTAIGEYEEAIKYHLRRLAIANDAKDLPAKARACGNLGNAYSALAQFSEALKYYQQSLSVSKDANNLAGEGQAFYCLGSTYSHLKNHGKAIEFHEKHVEIAKQLGDTSGELRGYYNLRNAHHSLGETQKVVYYHNLIKKMQPDKDKSPKKKPNSMTKGDPPPAKKTSSGADKEEPRIAQYQTKTKVKKEKKKKEKKERVSENAVQAFVLSSSEDSDDDEIQVTRKGGKLTNEPDNKKNTFADAWLEGAIEEVRVGNYQSGSQSNVVYDDEQPAGSSGTGTLPSEDFFDMLMSAQASGLDNQRSLPPGAKAPSKHDANSAVNSLLSKPYGSNDDESLDSFFDMIVASQGKYEGSRLSDQRADPNAPGADEKAKEVEEKLDADNMSFFEMLEAAK